MIASPLSKFFSLRAWDRLGKTLLNLLVYGLVIVYLFPLTYMVVTAFKPNDQLLDTNSPLWPALAVTFSYEGKERVIYNVPTAEGMRQWALVTPHRQDSDFIDPAQPEAGLIHWVGSWRTLNRVYTFAGTLDNFSLLWNSIDFPAMLQNTLWILIPGEISVLLASILVAYGFARFPIPGEKWLFGLLIATIMLPEKVTLIPTYFLYMRVFHWGGTWWPFIVPQLFGNAIFIFLLRQNFKTIPKDLDEAAMLDGADPLRTLVYVILPQVWPVVITVALLQFFYAWNETRVAQLYLSTAPDKFPLSYAVQQYGNAYFSYPNQLQASALIAMVIPVLVLFLAQRFFMQDVRVTGMEK